MVESSAGDANEYADAPVAVVFLHHARSLHQSCVVQQSLVQAGVVLLELAGNFCGWPAPRALRGRSVPGEILLQLVLSCMYYSSQPACVYVCYTVLHVRESRQYLSKT